MKDIMVKLCRWIKLRQSDVRVPETTKHTYYSTVQHSTASASQPFLNVACAVQRRGSNLHSLAIQSMARRKNLLTSKTSTALYTKY